MYKFNEVYEMDDKKLKRVNARKVDNLLKNKKEIIIYTIPINLNYKSPFVNGMFEVEKNQYRDYWDCINELHEISYYNCSKETGNYLAFFVEV